jgi:hypothetical protein
MEKFSYGVRFGRVEMKGHWVGIMGKRKPKHLVMAKCMETLNLPRGLRRKDSCRKV